MSQVVSGAYSSSLWGRCTATCRIIPAILTVAVCIIGIFAALYWKSPYMTIPFAVGCLASFYSIYLANIFGNLKSFGENNLQLAGEVSNLRTENAALRSQIETLETTNKELGEKLQELNTSVNQLGIENTQLKDTREQLNSEVAQLKGTRSTLENDLKRYSTEAEEHKKHLQGIREQMQNVQKQTTATFSDFIKSLQTSLTILNHENTQLEKSTQAIGTGIAQNVQSANSLHGELTNMVASLHSVLDVTLGEEAVKQRHEEQLKLTENVGNLKGQIEQLQRTKEEIAADQKKFKEQWETFLEQLNTKVRELGQNTQDVELLRHYFAEYLEKDSHASTKQ